MTGGALGRSIRAVYSVLLLRNCLTAESLDERYKEKLHKHKYYINRLDKINLTRVCNSVVIHMRVRPGPEFDFGWPRSARRKDWRGGG